MAIIYSTKIASGVCTLAEVNKRLELGVEHDGAVNVIELWTIEEDHGAVVATRLFNLMCKMLKKKKGFFSSKSMYSFDDVKQIFRRDIELISENFEKVLLKEDAEWHQQNTYSILSNLEKRV